MDEIGPIVEQTTGIVTCQLVSEDGVTHVQKTDITSATLSLIDEDSGTVINTRDKEDCLALIDSDGLFTWQLEEEDTTIVSTDPRAYHIAILAVKGNRTGGGTWTLRYRFRIGIDNWERIE
jgi:hypothetical protein